MTTVKIIVQACVVLFFFQALFFQYQKVKELCNSIYDQVTWQITAGQLPCECSWSLVRAGYYSDRNMQAYIRHKPLLSIPINSLNLFEPFPPPKCSPSDFSYTTVNTVFRNTFPRNFQFRASTWRFQRISLCKPTVLSKGKLPRSLTELWNM